MLRPGRTSFHVLESRNFTRLIREVGNLTTLSDRLERLTIKLRNLTWAPYRSVDSGSSSPSRHRSMEGISP
jgi:hypothetical protein